MATYNGGPYPRPDLYSEHYELTVTRSPTDFYVCLGDTVRFTAVVRKFGHYLVRRGPSKNVGTVGYDVDLGPVQMPVSTQYDSSVIRPIGAAPNSGVFSFRAIKSDYTPVKFEFTDPDGHTLVRDARVDVKDCDYRVITMSMWYVTAEANVMAVTTMNTVLTATSFDPSHLELSNPNSPVFNIAAYAIGRACPAQEFMSSSSANVDGQVDLDAGTMWVNIPYPSIPVGTGVVCLVVGGHNALPDSGDPNPFKVTLNDSDGGVADVPEPQLRVPGLGVSDGDTHVIIRRIRS